VQDAPRSIPRSTAASCSRPRRQRHGSAGQRGQSRSSWMLGIWGSAGGFVISLALGPFGWILCESPANLPATPRRAGARRGDPPSWLSLQSLPHNAGEKNSAQPLLKRFTVPQATLYISCDLNLARGFSRLASVYSATILLDRAANREKGFQQSGLLFFYILNP